MLGTASESVYCPNKLGVGMIPISTGNLANTILQLSGTGINNQLNFNVSNGSTNNKNWSLGPNGSTFYIYTLEQIQLMR